MEILFIVIFLCLIGIIIYLKQKLNIKNEINKQIDEENKKKEQINKELKEKHQEISRQLDIVNEQLLKNMQALNETSSSAKNASESYYETIDVLCNAKEEEYDNLMKKLEESYNQKQESLLKEVAEIQLDLDKITATRAAAIQAQIKEKEIQADLSFYCLSINKEDLDDVKTLERIKSKLHQPRILCMLIWSTYFQKSMSALCNNILGLETITGIYKITNQATGECYIGQSLDIAKRWKNHVKCGLGIDTPSNNKLYKAMQEYGVWNFSFELLEKCNRNELDEKERFFINLYKSVEYGYNSNAGRNKSN